MECHKNDKKTERHILIYYLSFIGVVDMEISKLVANNVSDKYHVYKPTNNNVVFAVEVKQSNFINEKIKNI